MELLATLRVNIPHLWGLAPIPLRFCIRADWLSRPGFVRFADLKPGGSLFVLLPFDLFGVLCYDISILWGFAPSYFRNLKGETFVTVCDGRGKNRYFIKLSSRVDLSEKKSVFELGTPPRLSGGLGVTNTF